LRDSIEVHHVEEGSTDGPVLVLSNSLGSSLAMWDPQVPELRKHFRVVRYDHRGHGASSAPPGRYTIAQLGSDLVDLMDRLEVSRAHMCGLSLGGMVGVWVASHAPERVDRLVLCCTSTRIGTEESWAQRAETVRSHGMEAVADTVLGAWFTSHFTAANREIISTMRAMFTATAPDGYAACCDLMGQTDLASELERIRAPTLVIAGADDPATPPESAYRIAEGIRDCRVSIVRDAAHLANVQQPEAVTGLILAHLLEAPMKEDP
jgi:3-oxoadipate enol-lactonase